MVSDRRTDEFRLLIEYLSLHSKENVRLWRITNQTSHQTVAKIPCQQDPFLIVNPNPHGLGRQPSLSTKIAPDKEKRELAQIHATFANRGEVKEIIRENYII